MAVLHGYEDWYSLTRSLMDLNFKQLGDTPDSYADQAGKAVKVSADETALVFSDSLPDAHHTRHETAGQDQVDHGGLSGLGDNDHPQYVSMGAIYPVGSIYISTLSTNPAVLLGLGTWAAFGAGKTLVSLDPAETEFDTVEETGGEKTHALSTAELASHTHDITTGIESADHTHLGSGTTGTVSADHTHMGNWGEGVWCDHAASGYHLTRTDTPGGYGVQGGVGVGGITTNHTHGYSFTTSGRTATHTHSGTSSASGSGTAHNNLQPYIVVYMWKRTA